MDEQSHQIMIVFFKSKFGGFEEKIMHYNVLSVGGSVFDH
jgi:hypothetical protein